MDQPLVNRVANSSLKTINLEAHFPPGEIESIDLKDYLYMELILKEKDFRSALNEIDWSQYQGKNLAVHCSTDAIIPVWAWMLVVSKAEPFCNQVYLGNEEDFIQQYYINALAQIDLKEYQDKRIVIKGCSDKPVPPSAYLELTKLLRPVAKSIMYGEPCSTVPIYKKPK